MFHPYSFYLQKHKNAKIKRESALPFFSFPLLLHLVIHTPNVKTAFYYVPFHLLGCPISPFGVSHFAIWDVPFYHLECPISPFGVSHFAFWGILRRVYAPILAPFYPLFALISSHFRGKNGRQNVCLSPQLSGNQIPSHQCVTCKPVSEFLYPPLVYFLKKLVSLSFEFRSSGGGVRKDFTQKGVIEILIYK